MVKSTCETRPYRIDSCRIDAQIREIICLEAAIVHTSKRIRRNHDAQTFSTLPAMPAYFRDCVS